VAINFLPAFAESQKNEQYKPFEKGSFVPRAEFMLCLFYKVSCAFIFKNKEIA
jgi:hypothetical protein